MSDEPKHNTTVIIRSFQGRRVYSVEVTAEGLIDPSLEELMPLVQQAIAGLGYGEQSMKEYFSD